MFASQTIGIFTNFCAELINNQIREIGHSIFITKHHRRKVLLFV